MQQNPCENQAAKVFNKKSINPRLIKDTLNPALFLALTNISKIKRTALQKMPHKAGMGVLQTHRSVEKIK